MDLKLDQALMLAKKKLKDGSAEEAKHIYQDILAKFPANEKAKRGIKPLLGNATGKALKVQNPSQSQLQILINLYSRGQLQQASNQANSLLNQFPHSVALNNICGAIHTGLKQYGAAINNYKQALKIKPNYAEAHYNMGAALMGKGDPDAAIISYKKALKIKPDYAESHNNIGAVLMGKGDPDAAIVSYKKALIIKPDYTESHNNMGNALMDKGDPDAAIVSYKKALKIKPDYAEAYNNMGNALKEKEDPDAAIKSYKKALQIKPDYAVSYYNIGAVLMGKGEPDAAIVSYKKALKIKPDYAEAHYNIGAALKDKGDPDAAIVSYKKALKIKPEYAEACNNMGNALMDKGHLDAAIVSYKKAVQIKPDYAESYKNMGAALMDKGNPDAAINSYKKALAIRPDYADTHRNLSNITIYKTENSHFLEMQKLYQDKTLNDAARCNLSFALAKAHEDLGESKKAFSCFSAGNALRKKMLGYTIDQDQNLFTNLRKAQPSILKHALKYIANDSGPVPVFILGMPRSGTTLVEQIISSHSGVTAAGELKDIGHFGELLAQGVTQATTEAVSEFRQNYLSELIKRSDGNSLITDKLPQNFRYIPLICSAFPEAKIIHVQRDAAATCWSNYKHYFPANGLGYCYGLKDVTAYYALYSDFMQFLQTSYGDRMYHLNYEKLTTDQDVESRNLIQYLELEWENACLSPQANKRSVRTASQQQVRKKIYKGSSQQWRKYEPLLNGAFDELMDFKERSR